MVAQGGFYESRRTNKTGIALVVAGHAAAIVALLLAKGPPVVTWLPTNTMIENIKEPPAPQPEKEKPLPKVAPKPSQIDVVKPVVPFEGTMPGPIIVNIDPPTFGETTGTTPTKPIIEPVFVQAIMDASAATRFQPDYPPALLRADIEGSATVRILIGTDGRVHQVEKVLATEPAFFDATERQALRYWRFKPATRDGVRVESWRTLTVRFKVES